jgi:hypothetical protein
LLTIRHSHSIVFYHRNALIFQRNRLLIRQKFGLLNSKANFADSDPCGDFERPSYSGTAALRGVCARITVAGEGA